MSKIRKTLAVSALASMIALPLAAAGTSAEAASCSSRKLNGTLIGGVGGALLGGAVTHGSTGPIVGGLAGAVAGHEIGRSGCRRYTRTARTRTYYRSAPANYYAAPRSSAVRKVYYDQYGMPIAQEYR